LHDPTHGFRSFGDIQRWLHHHFGVWVRYPTVHRTVRYRIGAQPKVPRPQSEKQDPNAVDRFKKNSERP